MTDITIKLPAQCDRRKVRLAERELLTMRLQLLERNDRAMLDLFLNHDVSLAGLSRLNHLDPRVIARHIDRLIERLLDENYITIIRNRKLFTAADLAVAYDRYLLGLGYRRIAAKRSLGQFTVRQTLKKLDKWLHAALTQKQESIDNPQ